MRFGTLILKILFSCLFLCFSIKTFLRFDEMYLKFSLIDVISRNHLAKLFYVIVTLPFFLSIGIYFIEKSLFRIIFEVLLLLYSSFIIAFLVYINFLYEGCVECSFGVQYFHESTLTTFLISLIPCIIYFLIIYLNNLNKQKAELPIS